MIKRSGQARLVYIKNGSGTVNTRVGKTVSYENTDADNDNDNVS